MRQRDDALLRANAARKMIRLNDWLYHLAMTEHNDTGDNAASRVCGRAQQAIEELFELARGGDNFAAWFLAILIDDCTLQLNLLKHRKLFRDAASKMPHWPVLASKNEALGHDIKKIVDALDVGGRALLFIDKFGKPTLDVFLNTRCSCATNFKATQRCRNSRKRKKTSQHGQLLRRNFFSIVTALRLTSGRKNFVTKYRPAERANRRSANTFSGNYNSVCIA
jgi:hypothetical protein